MMSDKRSDYYNKKIYGTRPRRKRAIFRLLPSNISDKKILDIGCGDGSLGEELEKRGARVTGLDVSVDAIEKAKKRLDKALIIDVEKDSLPFSDNYFDIIIASEIIEHIFSPSDLLKEIRRVLKKEGFFILTVPNFLVFSNRLKMLFGKFCYTEGGLLDFGHIRFFNYAEIKRILKESGFVIEEENHLINYTLGMNIFLRLIRKIHIIAGQILPSLFAFQFIIKAKKSRIK